MSEKMDKLLAEITPEKTLDKYEARMWKVLNRYPFPPGPFNDREAFEMEIARLEQHIMHSWADVVPKLEPSEIPILRDLGVTRLLNCFGSDGHRVAFEMARTGIDGGFRAVAKAMADNAAHQFATNIIGCSVHEYWNSLTVKEQLAATEEYYTRIQHMLPPSGLISPFDARYSWQPSETIARYPYLIRRFRQASTAPG